MSDLDFYVRPDHARVGLQNSGMSLLAALQWVTPAGILLAFLFLQPAFDFTFDDTLNLVKHVLLRGITLVMLFLTLAHSSLKHGRFILSPTGLEKPLLVYAGTAIASVCLAMVSSRMDMGRAAVSLSTLPILVSLLYIFPYWCDTKESILRLSGGFLLSVFLVAIIAIGQFVLKVGYGFGPERISSVFHDPNIFSRYVVFGLFYALVFLLFAGRGFLGRWATVLFLAAGLAGLLVSLSRSSLATFLLGSLFLAFLTRNRRIVLAGFLLAVAFAAIAYFMISAERSFIGSVAVDMSTINRVQVMVGGLAIFEKHWLLGIGYTNFQHFFAETYLKNQMIMSLDWYEAKGLTVSIHNWLVEVLAEQGVLGLCGFVWFFASFFKRLRAARRKTQDAVLRALLLGHMAMLFTFLFHGFFYHTFISQFFFWVIAGFAMATVRFAEA